MEQRTDLVGAVDCAAVVPVVTRLFHPSWGVLTDATSELVHDLYRQIVDAVGNGARRIAIWGPDAVGVELMAALSRSGMTALVSLILTDDDSPKLSDVFGIPAVAPDELAESEIDTLVVTSDLQKADHLKRAAQILDKQTSNHFPRVIFAGSRQYDFVDPVFTEIVKSSPVKSKAGGYDSMLIHLYQAIRSIALRRLNGDVAEFGVFQGGTTVLLARMLSHFGHPARIYGFDTFAGFPPAASLLDLYSDNKCEFADFDTVQRYCAPFNIDLIQGDIKTTSSRLRETDLVLSFFDTDNYSAARAALEICVRRTVIGGFIAFDHYYSPSWPKTLGERIAACELLDRPNWFGLHGTGLFVRLS